MWLPHHPATLPLVNPFPSSIPRPSSLQLDRHLVGDDEHREAAAHEVRERRHEPVAVLVAKSLIPKGMSGDLIGAQELFQPTTAPKGQVKDGAVADPGTLRRDFGTSIGNNATHGSDAPETAAFELGYFFAGMDLA